MLHFRLVAGPPSANRPCMPRWYKALQVLEARYPHPAFFNKQQAVTAIRVALRCTALQALASYGLIQQRGLVERVEVTEAMQA